MGKEADILPDVGVLRIKSDKRSHLNILKVREIISTAARFRNEKAAAAHVARQPFHFLPLSGTNK
jgi:hypothetical protein